MRTRSQHLSRILWLMLFVVGIAGAQQAAKAPAADQTKPVAKKSEPARSGAARRDPFVSPIRIQEQQQKSSPACATGVRCLDIQQLVLKGVVKTQGGMIAMVENSAKKQYNLREKDILLNGVVDRITIDAVTFRQSVTDNLGRPATREVVKRVTVSPV